MCLVVQIRAIQNIYFRKESLTQGQAANYNLESCGYGKFYNLFQHKYLITQAPIPELTWTLLKQSSHTFRCSHLSKVTVFPLEEWEGSEIATQTNTLNDLRGRAKREVRAVTIYMIDLHFLYIEWRSKPLVFQQKAMTVWSKKTTFPSKESGSEKYRHIGKMKRKPQWPPCRPPQKNPVVTCWLLSKDYCVTNSEPWSQPVNVSNII